VFLSCGVNDAGLMDFLNLVVLPLQQLGPFNATDGIGAEIDAWKLASFPIDHRVEDSFADCTGRLSRDIGTTFVL
jgi:hypothetical protein